ncbi:MAG: hypothetical protein LBD06_11310 [Candidatus Accumulibacter sp.]|jgi:methylase of polypeptide subunit release factors|nr:hypothetical protein [Accumulibacter sp.]
MASPLFTANAPAGTPLNIDAARYLATESIRRVKPEWRIIVAERAFRPRPENPQADWLPTVVAPALKLIAEDHAPVRAFASIGTGAGVDILAGIELLGASVVGATDIFPDITDAADWNIRQNLSPDHPVDVHVAPGDLLSPLAGRGLRFDVIYENLPNIPLSDAGSLEEKRKSSSFVPPRAERVPPFADHWMLALHYVALAQALDFLNPGGFVISTLGGRIPLDILQRLALEAGLKPSFLNYSWKAQAEGEDVLPSYTDLEARGFGPFHYYPVDVLEKVFDGVSPRESGLRAFEIERELQPHRVTAAQAWQDYQQGHRVGHTVAVLKSSRG